jgi:predicted enzyme related to lactoylglutathione lyase
MSNTFKASRDIIVRTENWSEALKFYGSVLGLPITEKGETSFFCCATVDFNSAMLACCSSTFLRSLRNS